MPFRKTWPLLASYLLVSCAVGEKHPFITQLAYPGEVRGEPLRLSARGRLPARDRSPRILLGRAGPGSDVLDLVGSDSLNALDEKQAYRLGGIAQWTLIRELGIADSLGLTLVLFPLQNLEACVLEAEMPLEEGIAFGIPSQDGQIQKTHASGFLYGLVYFYASTYLTNAALGEIQLTYRDERAEWIVDGASRLLATIAFLHALRDRERATEFASLSFVPALEAERQRGTETISLIDATTGETSAGPSLALRQATAELLVFRWYTAARKNDLDHPIAHLVKWARGQPLGPTYEELTEWMRKVSGVNVADEAKSTPLELVIAYHKSNWLNLGWGQATEKAPRKP